MTVAIPIRSASSDSDGNGLPSGRSPIEIASPRRRVTSAARPRASTGAKTAAYAPSASEVSATPASLPSP